MQFGLIEAVRHWGTYRRDRIALVSNGRETTYGDLLAASERVAAAIVDLGVEGRVAVAAHAKKSFIIALLGAMRAGRSAVVLNPRLDDDVLGVTVADTEPTILLQDRVLANTWTPGALARLRRVMVDELGDRPPADVPWPDYSSDTEWGIVFSSGSTGVPKGIERDHESMVTEILGWCLELPLNRNSVFYLGRPLFYTGGLVLSLSSLFVGATVVANDYEEDDDTAKVWDDYQRELSERDVEWAFFVPDQIRAFSKVEPKPERYAAFVLVMGAPISGYEKRTARDVLGSQIVESWGNSESLGTITEPEDLDQRPDSVGRPFLTDELWVVDETLRECPPGELGRIAGAETAGFQKYSNRPDATMEVKQNALIISDDIGRCDEDGYFYVAGRDQDVVFRGNTSLVLPRIADKIRACHGVAEVEVCASDGDGDVEIVAAIVLTPAKGSDDDELCGELNAALDMEERLSRVVVVEALPRLASGKVDRLAVRALLFVEPE